jgi:hypothetical protein
MATLRASLTNASAFRFSQSLVSPFVLEALKLTAFDLEYSINDNSNLRAV